MVQVLLQDETVSNSNNSFRQFHVINVNKYFTFTFAGTYLISSENCEAKRDISVVTILSCDVKCLHAIGYGTEPPDECRHSSPQLDNVVFTS